MRGHAKSAAVSGLLAVFLLGWVMIQERSSQNPLDQVFEPSRFLQSAPAGPKFVVLYAMDDCSLCLFEMEYWNALHTQMDGLLSVHGFVVAETQLHQDFLHEHQVQFEVRQDDAFVAAVRDFLDGFGLELKTPMKFLLDGDNRVLFYEYGEKNTDKQALLPQRIRALLN